MLTLNENGQNDGSYVSHKRIVEINLKKDIDFIELTIPRMRYLIQPFGMGKLVQTIKQENPDIVQVTGLQLVGFLSMIARLKLFWPYADE